MDAYTNLSAVYDKLMNEMPYLDWIAYINDTIQSAGLKKDALVLDAGCGTGRIAIGLKKAGYHVIGLDNSDAMLRSAEENIRKAGLEIPLVCQSLSELALHQPVDAVTAVCDVFNYIETDELSSVFESLSNNLKNGGLLIFDISSMYKLKEIIGSNVFYEDREEMTYIWTNHLSKHSVKMDITIFTKKDDGYIRDDETHIQYIHSRQTIEKALKQSGFRLTGVFDGYTKNKAKDKTERITFVAYKEKA